MAKQKRTLSRNYKIPQYIRMFNGNEISTLNMTCNDATRICDVEYYKDQSDNDLFMSMKEDLIKLIKKDFKFLKDDYKNEESGYKKSLIKSKILKFKNINLDFPNTWEAYEVVNTIYNNGDILDESEIEELREKQKKIREEAKKTVFCNAISNDKFISTYFYISTNIVFQVFVMTFIFSLINNFFIDGSSFLEVFNMWIFPQLPILFIYVIHFFAKEKLLRIYINRSFKKDKKLSRDFIHSILKVLGVMAMFGLVRRIFFRPKEE